MLRTIRFPSLRAAAQSSTSSILLFVATLLAVVLLEIPVGSAILVVALLAILMTLGTRLTQVCGLGKSGLGVSLLVGSCMLVFPVQFILSLGISSQAAHWITLSGLCALTVLARPSSLRAGTLVFDGFRQELSFALGVALFACALRHPWLFPFVAVYLVCDRILASSNRLLTNKVFAVSVAALLSGAGISLVLRPAYWWFYYQNGDASFFEAISWSFSEWGVFDSPGAAGNSSAAYHWFSYAFYGSVSHLASLEPWDALMKLGTPLNQVILANLLVPQGLPRRKQIDSIAWLVVILCVTGLGWWRVDSASFGMLAGLALIKLTAAYSRAENPRIRTVLLFFAVALLSILSKATTGLVIGLVLLLFPISQIVSRRKPFRFQSVLPFICWISASSFAYVVFFRGGEAENSLLRGGAGLLASASAFQAINELLPKRELWLALVMLLLIARLPTTRATPFFAETRQLVFVFLALCPAILAASPFPNSHLFVNPFYFYLIAITGWLFQLESSHSTEKSPQINRVPRQYVFVALASLLISSIYRVGLNRLDPAISRSTSQFGQVTWEILYSHSPLVALVIGLGYLLSRYRSSWKPGQLLGVLLIGFSIVVGGWFDLARRTHEWGPSVYTSSEVNQAPFATSDLADVGTYVRLSTDADAILATNDFCCSGMTWWNSIRTQLSQDSQGRTQGWSELQVDDLPVWGGDNYSASAVTRRRFVMLGLGFQTGQVNGPSLDQINRMNLSLQFANGPTQETLDGLKGYGASGYVVNLSLTDNRDWSEFAIEKFRSGDFLYLELR